MSQITINQILDLPVINHKTHTINASLNIVSKPKRCVAFFGWILHVITFGIYSKNPSLDRTLRKILKVARKALENPQTDLIQLKKSLLRLQPLVHDHPSIRNLSFSRFICSLPSTDHVRVMKAANGSEIKALLPPAAVESQEALTLSSIVKKKNYVSFYNDANPTTYFLSSSFPCQVVFGGNTYISAYSAYQAQKFIQRPDLQKQLTIMNASEAEIFAAKHNQSVDKEWPSHRLVAKEEVMKAKFVQNPQLAKQLLATGNAYIVMHAPMKGIDAYSTDNHDGSGQNFEGRLLMKVRQSLGGSGVVSANSTYYHDIVVPASQNRVLEVTQ